MNFDQWNITFPSFFHLVLSIDDMEAEDYFLQEEINKDTTGNMRKILEKRR